ncbi:MAG: purine-binding chemotaxis protein CheW [Pelomonas sp.]|nr:purine-binding chemotaxis protein CheW [Roseateles sp.]
MSTPTAETAGATRQFLSFTLGNEPYAIDIVTVREIIQHGSMTPVPLMPDFVRGVINLRGAVVPVIDLQARFGRGPASPSKKTCIVIVDATRDGERIELGLMVDAVSEVISLDPAHIEPAPQFGGATRRDFIAGMGKRGERFVVLLDPERAFDIGEMAALCEASQLSMAA